MFLWSAFAALPPSPISARQVAATGPPQHGTAKDRFPLRHHRKGPTSYQRTRGWQLVFSAVQSPKPKVQSLSPATTIRHDPARRMLILNEIWGSVRIGTPLPWFTSIWCNSVQFISSRCKNPVLSRFVPLTRTPCVAFPIPRPIRQCGSVSCSRSLKSDQNWGHCSPGLCLCQTHELRDMPITSGWNLVF